MTITYDEVTNLVGVNVPTTNNKCPNFKNIRLLHRHFKHVLQRLLCPQSTLHGWKGLVMAGELYALLTPTPFHTPNNPRPSAFYVRALDPTNPVPDPAPLTRTEQATINTTFASRKHYFLSMRSIEMACFPVLNLTINDTFKLSNKPAIQGWHVGMSVMLILDQLSKLYGQPTPAVLEIKNRVFRSPYSAADVPEVLFQCIKECAEIALLGGNPYTDRQLITNAICLLLTTGLYTRPFEEWDRLTRPAQTWITLQTII